MEIEFKRKAAEKNYHLSDNEKVWRVVGGQGTRRLVLRNKETSIGNASELGPASKLGCASALCPVSDRGHVVDLNMSQNLQFNLLRNRISDADGRGK